MNATRPNQIMQRWNVIQHELLPQLHSEAGVMTPKLEQVVHILDWVRIEEFVPSSWQNEGRPPHERSWLANAFVAKSVLGLSTTRALIDRLTVDRALRRICGFTPCRKLPSESTFSRAFDFFAKVRLAERVHEALIKEQLGDQLIGHISRDATAIVSRERPAKTPESKEQPASADTAQRTPKTSPIQIPRQQTLAQMIRDIPTACDRGTKSNAQGYKTSWNGYKLHLDTADCGIPVAAVLSSASMHDSRAAVPLSLISQQRVTNLYDVMDAAYCSQELHAHCRSLNHVPMIDHNPRGGCKEHFEPADAVRYNERTVAERTNARIKDEFGGNNLRVKGATKAMSHLMFGVLALSADQLMRLRH